MHRHRTWISAALGMTTMLLAAACGGGSTPAPAPSTAIDKIVPVISCPTTRGVHPHGAAHYETQLAAGVSPATVSQLSYYTDSRRQLSPVLGPRGWKCKAAVGADGGTRIEVFAPGTSPSYHLRVDAQAEPACQGCAYALVCHFVAAAKQQIGSGFPRCAETPHVVERLTWVRGPATADPTDDLLRFEDLYVPSPRHGVVFYKWTRSAGASAARETCALPPTYAKLCTQIVNDFQARNSTSF
ncbi:MAG TPA: hypothetical protein VHC43_15475 [Mycobacteriales bacterium]|nr:hypothetical protein [Mycobacteriales bacterium]